MTIKQQGGIFGRNPTFNDLTVEGTLTSSGTFAPSGQVTFSEDGDAALVVNRNTNNGTIVQVKQANAEVGYIGTYGGDLIVGTGDTSMRFLDSLDCYFPVSNATGTTRDNAIDIGYTEARYKDLYLGGGIYIQASSATPVAANYLDDYEEGTWTPAGNGVTLTSASGHYTKVGRLVHVHCQITFPTNSDTNNANIYGLPYTVGQQSTGHIGYNNFGSGTNKYFAAFSAGTHLRFYDDNGNNSTNATFSGKNVWITTTYGV